MHWLNRLLFWFAALAIAAVCAESRASDPDELFGTWNFEAVGSRSGLKKLEGFRVKIDRKRIVVIAPTGADKQLGEIVRIDAKKKPAEIDLKDGGKLLPGIFELNGDSLKLAVSEPGGKRPTEYAGKAGTLLFVLKRSRK
jgi:uncharacterized protein (TIGR03067 family)